MRNHLHVQVPVELDPDFDLSPQAFDGLSAPLTGSQSLLAILVPAAPRCGALSVSKVSHLMSMSQLSARATGEPRAATAVRSAHAPETRLLAPSRGGPSARLQSQPPTV